MSYIPEAKITINGHELNAAQSAAVRIACTDFCAQMLGFQNDADLAEISRLTCDRLSEVLTMMLAT